LIIFEVIVTLLVMAKAFRVLALRRGLDGISVLTALRATLIHPRAFRVK